jgi:hypothetical protein
MWPTASSPEPDGRHASIADIPYQRPTFGLPPGTDMALRTKITGTRECIPSGGRQIIRFFASFGQSAEPDLLVPDLIRAATINLNK